MHPLYLYPHSASEMAHHTPKTINTPPIRAVFAFGDASALIAYYLHYLSHQVQVFSIKFASKLNTELLFDSASNR